MVEQELKNSIETVKNSIVDIIDDNMTAIYLYGSVALNDFKLGWSDIDILCLTKFAITDVQARLLVKLRQALLEAEPGNLYYRSFEGGILPLKAFINKSADRVVYWGTRDQRITDVYDFDSFSMYELIVDGVLLFGNNIRAALRMPTYQQLRNDVIRHYQAIRKHAVKTDESMYSYGWLLDIARGIYTLRTGKVIAKTVAGEWALENNICPVAEALRQAVDIRNNPLRYKNDDRYKGWACALGREIQNFANVLENEINLTNHTGDRETAN